MDLLSHVVAWWWLGEDSGLMVALQMSLNSKRRCGSTWWKKTTTKHHTKNYPLNQNKFSRIKPSWIQKLLRKWNNVFQIKLMIMENIFWDNERTQGNYQDQHQSQNPIANSSTKQRVAKLINASISTKIYVNFKRSVGHSTQLFATYMKVTSYIGAVLVCRGGLLSLQTSLDNINQCKSHRYTHGLHYYPVPY